MGINLKGLSVEELRSLIHNYEKSVKTNEPVYLSAVSELDQRLSQGLKMNVTVAFLSEAARSGKFVSYGDVALANGSSWTKVRRLMPKHLDNVLSYCHASGIPYLTAIVVSQPNLSTGAFDESNLRGFIEGLKRLGLEIVDHREFAEQEQKRVFSWGEKQVG